MKRYLILIILIGLLCSCLPEKKKTTSIKAVVEGIYIGNKAPEISFPGPDGKICQLTALRGKMVLVNFWASWCPPCRNENRFIVEAYKKYKNSEFAYGKGFSVYSVSCDKDADRWKDAILHDSLIWENHVSELKGWDTQATIDYRIGVLPSNVLISGEGIILARNLRGEQLELTLKKYLTE